MIKLNGKNNSEIIVNSIINKIISLSITKSIDIKINKQIPEKCFNFVKEMINNKLSSLFIFYDKDEERNINGKELFKSNINEINDDNNNNFNKIEISNDESKSFLKNHFFSNTYCSENNWDLMDEPISSNLDRYSSTLIKFQEREEDKYGINKDKILEEEDISENSKSKKKKEFHKISKKFKSTLYRTNFNKLLNNEEENKKPKMSHIMNQLTTLDLEPEKNYENKQIVKLRAIFEKSKKEKEKEKEINREEQEKIKLKQKLAEDNLRKYVGKKINKDHNGEIIFIKSIKENSLEKEFIFTKSKCKTININKINEPNVKEKLKDVKVEINKDEINEEKPKMKIKNNSIKLKLLNNVETIKNKNMELRPISLKKNVPLIPSGSNFYLMNMEVGVSIKEDEKFKTGGLDFFNKYKKYSIQVYDKKLKEAEKANNLLKSIDILKEPKTQTIEEMHNLYKTNYTLGNSTYDEYNSTTVLNTASNMFNKRTNINLMNLTNTNNSSIFQNYSKQANMSTNKSKNNLNLTPIINIKSGASSLFNSFNQLNLLSNQDNNYAKKTKNIFREKMSKKVKKYFLDDINNFTKNLITNKKDEKFSQKVMNTTGRIKGISYPGKPNMREIIQEVGLKGKIPRQRTKFFSSIKSNILENENFFKKF